MITEIISGGQTRVDQAAFDAAIELTLPYFGKCPQGRIAEDGFIPQRFSSLEQISGEFRTENDSYDAITKKNIEESDGTLILVPKIPLPTNIKDGTLLTIEEVKQQKKHHLLVDLSKSQTLNASEIINWINHRGIKKLNVAGPRESNARGIYNLSLELLKATLLQLKNTPSIRSRL